MIARDMIAWDIDRIQSAFSSTYHVWKFYDKESLPPSVIAHLENALPHIDPTSWHERLEFGGVFINGLPALSDTALPAPCKIEYYEPRFPLEEAASHFASFHPEYIVFEDTHLAVIFKPARLPSMPGKEQRAFNMRSYLDKHFRCTIHMPSRLDMSTQGLLIVSKTEAMHGPLQKLFEEKRIGKRYLLETSSAVTWSEHEIDHPIGKTPHHPVLRAVCAEGKRALTRFTRVATSSLTTLDGRTIPSTIIEATPVTGRTHQIRVHSAYGGFPVAGDNFYGGERCEGLHLLSHRLDFTHPFTREELRICLPPSLYPQWAVCYSSA